MNTICGIPLTAFANRPTPEEIEALYQTLKPEPASEEKIDTQTGEVLNHPAAIKPEPMVENNQLARIAIEWARIWGSEEETYARAHLAEAFGIRSRKELTQAQAIAYCELLAKEESCDEYKRFHSPATKETLQEIGTEWIRVFGDVAKDIAARESAQAHIKGHTKHEKRNELNQGEAEKYLAILNKMDSADEGCPF